MDLHLNGNIVGFQRTRGNKKLLVFGSSSLFAAVAEFSSKAFHEMYLRRFYDLHLKGQRSTYSKEAAVRYFMTGADGFLTADIWPPTDVEHRQLFLRAGPTGTVTSPNDSALDFEGPGEGRTEIHYPNPGWRAGVVGFDKDGRTDPVRRVLKFTSRALADDLEIAGPVLLVLYAASSNSDTDFVVKILEQRPVTESDRAHDIQPRSMIVTKGWLRASHREIDPTLPLENAPSYTHTSPTPIEPGQVYKFEIAVMPTAYRFKKGSRIRLELANGGSQFTGFVFQHDYTPNKVGTDVIHHDELYPSHLVLPVIG